MEPFTFQIFCRSGLFVRGASDDFLFCVYRARLAKASAVATLPNSVFRAQICAPSGARVASDDIKAAVIALNDDFVMRLLSARHPAAFQPVLAVALDLVFSQAGVVAPPDSPDLGNLPQITVTSKAAFL